ncbi:Zn-ribbon domain-containing protein [Halalkalicoccus sp. NIPERK01]|uniref:Zn-ribbon domain-containing protein n=1 Tax=Halalkalicoccus sp. NIPERK01 TaxID=3053469 RepID=UPI00256F342C|nr:Zn-ribbon domain-containing protein [Halalkalicoccus sp. NIPERK01]
MPHQCTECGHTFADGSKEMLSGCPECGGNKFQFLPEGADRSPARSPPEPAEPAAEPEELHEPDEPTVGADREDSAQADARSSMVDADELSEAASEPASEPAPDEPTDLAQLREELNDQFESIRIVDHGQYELNLMELYKREEFIIALQENGRYVIEVPESFRRGPEN